MTGQGPPHHASGYRLIWVMSLGVLAGVLIFLGSLWVAAHGNRAVSLAPARGSAEASAVHQEMALTGGNANSSGRPFLLIPAAQVYSEIVEVYLDNEGWNVADLANRVGHLEGTSQPGRPGNVVLVGHIELQDGSAGVFSRVGDLRVGDVVIVYLPGGEADYVVKNVLEIDAVDLSALYPTGADRITLITCTDYNIISNSYYKRIVVIAEPA
jgi:LPXTG-site transpeptidase (sortase) family protein